MLQLLYSLILCVFVAISPSYAATELKDEGIHKGWVTSIDCTGAGIDCSALGIQGTVNVPGGGSGTPGGNDTEIQYNNSGSFDGIPNAAGYLKNDGVGAYSWDTPAGSGNVTAEGFDLDQVTFGLTDTGIQGDADFTYNITTKLGTVKNWTVSETLTVPSGNYLPTTADQSSWDNKGTSNLTDSDIDANANVSLGVTAYGWGDWSGEGFITLGDVLGLENMTNYYNKTEVLALPTLTNFYNKTDIVGSAIGGLFQGINADNISSGTVNAARMPTNWLTGSNSTEICFVFSNDTSTLTAGQDVVIPIPYNITVSSSEIVADISGSATAQIYMCDYATYNISAAHKNMTIIGNVTLTTDYKSQDTTLSNWDKTLDAKSYVRCNLTSVATIKSLTVTLFGNYTGD